MVNHGREDVSWHDGSTRYVAQIHDCLLGGKNHTTLEQAAAQRVLAAAPEMRALWCWAQIQGIRRGA